MIISVHVPKTAGTTFKKVLQKVYTEEEIFFDYPHRGLIRNRMLTQDRANIKVIHGHFPGNKYEGKYPAAKKIIWLRNPIERLISHYFFWKSWQTLTSSETECAASLDFPYKKEKSSGKKDEKLTIIQFAEKPEMQNLLAINFIKNQKLTDFYFIGIQERFEEDIAQLRHLLNWPHIELESKNKNPYPEYNALLQQLLSQKETIAKIAALNQQDLELYREALSLRERRTKSLKLTCPLPPPWGKDGGEAKQRLPQTEPIFSWGFIDKAELEGQVLSINGWAASWQKGPLKSLKVSIADRQYTFFDQLLGIPSPDVAALHPTLDHPEEARFRLKILLDRQQIQKLNQGIIVLFPKFREGEGIVILKAFRPTTPPPQQQLLKPLGIENIEALTRYSLKLTGQLLQRTGLLTTDRILELGCSLGLAARSLIYYLQLPGSYEGFDFCQEQVSWAKLHLTPKNPNFHFLWENVRHPLYNPRGTLSPTDIILPYPDRYFDRIIIPHLFARSRALTVRHYLKQIASLLKPDGQCLFHCFLINPTSQELMAKGASSHNFIHPLADGFTIDPDLPERAIAFSETTILHWIEEAGLKVVQKSYGSWSGRISFGGPDILILEKPS